VFLQQDLISPYYHPLLLVGLNKLLTKEIQSNISKKFLILLLFSGVLFDYSCIPILYISLLLDHYYIVIMNLVNLV
jgi:hypothetical protein